MILDSTAKSLTITLSGGGAIPFTVDYADTNDASNIFNARSVDGLSNGTTAAIMVPAPIDGQQRIIKRISVANDSGGLLTVTISLINGSSSRRIISVGLSGNHNLLYERDGGWQVIDGDGNIKYAVAAAGVSVTSSEVSAVSAQALSAINVVSNFASNLLSLHDVLSNRVSANSGTGGAGSVTSNEVSAVSAQAASAINVVSNGLSNEISNRVSADNLLSAVLTSAINVVSNGLSLVSNALSNETSNRISADNALSNSLSIISQQVSVLSSTGHLVTMQNVGAGIVSAGHPVYAFTSANTVKRTDGSTSATREVIGIAISTIAVSATGIIQTGGIVTLTTGQWDTAIGTTGGLNPGSKYYINSNTLGTTPGIGELSRVVGIALSPTQLLLEIAGFDDLTPNLTSVINRLSTLSGQVSTVSVAVTSVDARVNTLSGQVSVISQQVSVLSNVVSSLSSQLSLVSVLSVGGVSTEGLQSALNALSNRISAVVVGGGVSVTSNELSAASAQAASAINVVSNAASNALSVANIAFSVGNAASNAASIVSNQLSVVSSLVSNLTSAQNAISNFLSGLSGRSVGDISTKGLQSIINALSNRISANSGTGGSGSVTSNEASAISAQAASAINVVSNAVSIVSVAAANALSVANAASNAASIVSTAAVIALSVANAASNAASVVSNALSAHIALAGHIITFINGDVSALSAGRAVFVHSANAVRRGSHATGSAVSANIIGLVLDASVAVGASVRVQTQGLMSLTSAQRRDVIQAGNSAFSVGEPYKLFALGQLYNTNVAGGTSEELVLAHAINNSTILIQIGSDENRQSNAVSILSQQISVVSNAASNALSVGNAASLAAAIALSIANAASNAASVVSNALSNEISNRTSADNALSNLISAVSAAVTSVDGRVNTLSNQVSVISQQVSVLSQSHSALSQQVSVLSVQVSSVSVAVTSVDTHVNTVSNQVSIVSSLVSNLTSAHNALSNVVSNIISAGGGGVSVTSNELSTILNGYSARNTAGTSVHGVQSILDALSNRISAAGGASVTSTELSNALSIVSAQAQSAINIVSGRLGVVRFISIDTTVVASTMASGPIPGLTLSVSAGGLYELTGILMHSIAAGVTSVGFGFTFPAMTRACGRIFGQMSMAQEADASTNTMHRTGAWNEFDSGTHIISMTNGAAGETKGVFFNGVFLVSTTGTIIFQTHTTAGANPMHILAGSYVKLGRLNI